MLMMPLSKVFNPFQIVLLSSITNCPKSFSVLTSVSSASLAHVQLSDYACDLSCINFKICLSKEIVFIKPLERHDCQSFV